MTKMLGAEIIMENMIVDFINIFKVSLYLKNTIDKIRTIT